MIRLLILVNLFVLVTMLAIPRQPRKAEWHFLRGLKLTPAGFTQR